MCVNVSYRALYGKSCHTNVIFAVAYMQVFVKQCFTSFITIGGYRLYYFRLRARRRYVLALCVWYVYNSDTCVLFR